MQSAQACQPYTPRLKLTPVRGFCFALELPRFESCDRLRPLFWNASCTPAPPAVRCGSRLCPGKAARPECRTHRPRCRSLVSAARRRPSSRRHHPL